jgi:hypothetical protein
MLVYENFEKILKNFSKNFEVKVQFKRYWMKNILIGVSVSETIFEKIV